MKHDKLAPSLLLTCLLCLTCAPLSTAQQRQTRQPQRTPRQSAQPRRRPANERPVNTPAQQQPSSSSPQQQQSRRSAPGETERNFDALVAAESYGIYAEVRALGQFLRSEDFRRAADGLQALAGTTGAQEQNLVETLFFFATQAEPLKDARFILATMPTRDAIPDALFALEFSSVDAATGFEPKLRNFLSRQFSAANQRRRIESSRAAQSRQANADNSPQPSDSDAAQPSVEPPLKIRRVSNIIFATDRTFTLKAIGGRGLPTLADDTRFQSVRSRFAADPVFVYLDIARLEQADARSREKYERQRAEYEREAQQNPAATTATTDTAPATMLEAAPEPSSDVVTAPTNGEENPDPEPGVAVVMDEGVNGEGEPVNVATEEEALMQAQEAEAAAAQARAETGASDFAMALVFGRLMSGLPRWPESVGFSIGFDGDDYIFRALASNAPGGHHSVIPIFPAFVAGPVSTLEASSVAPGGSEIFATASIDWRQVYEAMLNPGPELAPPPPETAPPGQERIVEADIPEQTREQSIETFEKALGFKIKDHFLPALGHEIAFSAPLSWLRPGHYRNAARGKSAAAADEARPGSVVIVSLSDIEGMRKMLPRLLAAGAVAASNTVEKRAGIEINKSSGISYAFYNNYLLLAQETQALRHFIDTAQQQGLGTNQNFRNATAWQPRQKLGQVYISPALIESFINEARNWADPSDPELEAMLARLNLRPTATSYAVTDEGDGRLFHELRLPKSLLTIFSTYEAVFTRLSERRRNELTAMEHLRSMREMEEMFKNTTGKGRYASLDELQAKFGRPDRWPHILKDEMEKSAYKIEVTLSDTGFQATATPKEYSRMARRSFFIDESGVLRGADRKGEPATADDPPVD